MPNVDLSTVVFLDEGDGHIDSGGRLVTSSNTWQSWAFPSLLVATTGVTKVVVKYLPHPEAEFNLASLKEATVQSYDDSYGYTYGWTWIVSPRTQYPHLSIEQTDAVGTFTAYLGPGISQVGLGLMVDEQRLQWYGAQSMTILSVSYDVVELATSDWQEPGPDEEYPYAATQYGPDILFETTGVSHMRKTGPSGAGFPPLAVAEIVAHIELANEWPPINSHLWQADLVGNTIDVDYYPGYDGSLGENPYVDLTVTHGFEPRAFSVQRTYYPPSPWPEGVIGVAFHPDDSDSLAQQSAMKIVKLVMSPSESTMDHINQDQSTAWDDGNQWTDPAFSTEIMAAPAQFNTRNEIASLADVGVPQKIATYSYPGTGLLPEGQGALYPTIHPMTEFGPTSDVDLMPYVNVTQNGTRALGLLLTINHSGGPVKVAGSLFGTPTYSAGAKINVARIRASYRPPRYRWIFAEEILPTKISAGGLGARARFT